MDITPVISKNKKIIESYAENYFVINKEKFECNIIIFPDKVMKWEVKDPNNLSIEDFELLYNIGKKVLLIGTGKSHKIPSKSLLSALVQSSIKAEFMSSGAACRTYNILMGEERDVVAAILTSQ